MPKCRVCEKIKLASDFPRNRSYSSGHATLCKACSADRTRTYRKENPYYLQALKDDPKIIQKAIQYLEHHNGS